MECTLSTSITNNKYMVKVIPWGFVFFLFFVNPLLGIFLASFLVSRSNNYDYIKPLSVLIIFYLAALNTTKVVESDMIDYMDQYINIPKSGFVKNLRFLYNDEFIKDPGYGILVYGLYYLTFGNPKLFIVIITFLTYGFVFASIQKFGKTYKMPIFIVVSQILVLSFFTQYFSLSVQLIRQQLATSIFLYALTFKSTSFWKYISLCAIILTIHNSSMAPLVLLSLIPQLKERLSIKWLAIMIILSLSFFVVFSSLASLLLEHFVLGNDGIGRSVARVAEYEGAHDRGDGLDPVLGLVFSLSFFFLCLFENIRKSSMVYPIIINLCLIWCLIILTLSSAPVIQYRLFFVMYTFAPFVIFPFIRRTTLLAKCFCLLLVAFFIYRFYANLNGAFQYASVEDAILLPFFLLIQL